MENILKGEISAFILNIAHFSARSDRRYFSNRFNSSFSQVFQLCISYFALKKKRKRRREWKVEIKFY